MPPLGIDSLESRYGDGEKHELFPSRHLDRGCGLGRGVTRSRAVTISLTPVPRRAPIGPVRFDMGINLHPKLRPDGLREERVQFFFTLGHAF